MGRLFSGSDINCSALVEVLKARPCSRMRMGTGANPMTFVQLHPAQIYENPPIHVPLVVR